MSSEEEQLRAQLEEEMRRITVDDLLVQSVVSLVNLGGRKAGVAPGTEGERDMQQVKTAIDAVTALLPVLERTAGDTVKPIRDALSQLQMAYAKGAGGEGEEPGGEGGPQEPQPQPPPSSGRLWVPGQ